MFNAGKIEQVGTPEDVYDRPATPFVADFVGGSHFLPVTMVGGAAQINGRVLKLGEVASPGPRQFLVLRPEKLELGTPELEAEYNRFDGEVLRRVFLGDAVILSIAVADLPPITVKLGTSHRDRRDAGRRVDNLALAPSQGYHTDPGGDIVRGTWPLNEVRLKAWGWYEHLSVLALTLPALLLVSVVIFVPTGWVALRSFLCR